ncbi:alpha/beta fold hydrolase [Shewanella sp. A3A]|nr:alpha/beta fold hydrolase [Shewanella ferrihydritica]
MDIMHLRQFILFVIALQFGMLQGCASYVADQIVHPEKSLADIPAPKTFYAPLRLQNHSDCQAPCLHYVTGAPLTDDDELLPLEATFAQSPMGQTLTRAPDQQHFQGTVVLIHGYTANWSWMIGWSNYFQSLGFNTVMPDLPGHGATTIDDFSFGVRDTRYLKPLLEQLDLPRPWIVVGHSMGTIVASYLAQATDASGLLLIAPSSPLSQASVRAAQAFHPFASRLVPNRSLVAGSQQALAQLKIDDEQTDLREVLSHWSQPTMVLNASDDEVIGNEWIKALAQVRPYEYHQLTGNHAGILKPSPDAKKLVLDWLSSLTLPPTPPLAPLAPAATAQ